MKHPSSTAAPVSAEGADPGERLRGKILQAERAINDTVIGQPELVRGMMLGMLCGGHLLIEGVPGLAKTTVVSTFAKLVHATFCRLQFTPDLLPGDIVGSEIYRPHEHRFEVQRGPLFANLVLVDEINRAPAKVQSALLEAMQERQVSIAGQTFPLPQPFMVLATQNPIEQSGTYALPEAQMDRFLMKLMVDYPDRRSERDLLHRSLTLSADERSLKPFLELGDFVDAQTRIREVVVVPAIEDYVLDLVRVTRDPAGFGSDAKPLIRLGVSPRGTLALAEIARAAAFLAGRTHVTPDDVRNVVANVFRHRLVLSYEAIANEQTADDLINELVHRVPVP